MREDYKLFCFDMDGTLIRNTNSVRYLCELNNQGEKLIDIEHREDNREFSWIEADYLKAELIKGLNVEKIKLSFNSKIRLIDNIDCVVKTLKKRGIKCILVTAGPIQVANIVGELFDFDRVYGSKYEVWDDIFTGKIIEHLGEGGKLKSLTEFCIEEDIQLEKCVAVGDSDSDIDVFSKCGKSIAINYSDVLIGRADIYLKTNNLKDLLEHI